jgi:hypothetical protein
LAADPPVKASLHGNLKTFFVAGDSRPWFGLTDDAVAALAAAGVTEEEALSAYGLAAEPFAQGVASGRLLGVVTMGRTRLEAHWAFAAKTVSVTTGLPGVGTGVGLSAPELLPLTWTPDLGPDVSFQHRIDRLALSTKAGPVAVTVGRQPVSFGSGRVFTPLDLVNPFSPATIDTEYKPGVDAVRVDAFGGVATKGTVVAAWAGQPVVGDDARDPTRPVLDDMVLAAAGQATVGVTDLSVFLGGVRGEPVFGLGTVTAVGPVGVHADATLTLPVDGDPFVRAVVGADGRPTGTTTLAAELYVQTFGAADPSGYLDELSSDRFLRGEVWQLGRLYASVSVAQQITPLLQTSATIVTNVEDPSALLAVGGSWSIADEADLVFGGYAGIGAPPDEVDLDVATGGAGLVAPDAGVLAGSVRSEFGLYPAEGYLQVRVYF